ncbi:unnamed protein product, partial [Rotaria socialis]
MDVGRLMIYVRSIVSANFTSESLVWALAGPRGPEWKHAFVPIQPNGRYQIIIEGVRGKSFEGDVAVDDIGVLQTESCKLQPFEADPAEVSQALVTCRFEEDFC